MTLNPKPPRVGSEVHSVASGIRVYPDPREDATNRSLKGVPVKYPLVVKVPN